LSKVIAIYSDNQTKIIDTLCGQNIELLNVTADGIYALPLGFNGLRSWRGG
jgi:hypothetical protein